MIDELFERRNAKREKGKLDALSQMMADVVAEAELMGFIDIEVTASMRNKDGMPIGMAVRPDDE